MESLQICCLFVLFSICKGITWPNFAAMMSGTENPHEHIPQCTNDNKPCKLMVRDMFSNGTIKQEFSSSNICACADGTLCPSQWGTDPSRSITRSLRSQEKILLLQMKFCRQVQQYRRCRTNEVALTLSGISILPNQVESVNCRCEDDQAAYLQSVVFGRNLRRVEHFTCSMAECRVRSTRRTVCQLNYFRDYSPIGTHYPCQCPDRYRCMTGGSPRIGDCQRIYSYQQH